MLTHVWGLLVHPNREWKQIHDERETITHLYSHHVLEMALIPVVCAFIGTTQVGWDFGGGHTIQLNYLDAFFAGVAFYVAILVAVGFMGSVIHWMATPMFVGGIVALYPLVWLCLLAIIVGLCYSAYLLYLGIPNFLDIGAEEGFIVTGSTLGIGVLVLEALLGVTVLLWGYGAKLLGIDL